MKKLTLWSQIFAAVLLFAGFDIACAQENYPVRPVVVVVAWPAGSAIDVLMRQISDDLQAELGQPIVVENKGGAAGVIGAQAVASAKPDGYTLLFTSSALNMVAAMGTKTPYNVQDFTPVVNVARTPLIMVAHPSLNVKTPQELVDLAKREPGKLFYAVAGYGAPSHFAAEMFRARTGINVTPVTFRGSPDAMVAQVAGRVQFSITNSSTALPQIKQGNIVALAVTGASRLPTAPEIPTMGEQGFPGFEIASYWSGILGPKGLPPSIANRFASAINKVLARPGIREKLAMSGNVVDGQSNPASFAELLASDMKTWVEVAKTAGIKAQ